MLLKSVSLQDIDNCQKDYNNIVEQKIPNQNQPVVDYEDENEEYDDADNYGYEDEEEEDDMYYNEVD